MTRLATLSQRIARRAAAVELGLAVALALAAAALWAFAELAEEVMEGETRAFDTAILLALRIPGDAADPLGPPWLEEMARDVTGLGGLGVLTFLTLAAAGLLWLQRKHGTALYVLAATPPRRFSTVRGPISCRTARSSTPPRSPRVIR